MVGVLVCCVVGFDDVVIMSFSFTKDGGALLSSDLLMTDDGMRHIRLFQRGDLFLGQFHG